MSHPKLSLDVVRSTIAAVEAFLEAGYAPPGVSGIGMGAIHATAHHLGLTASTLASRLRSAKVHYNLAPDWSLYKDKKEESAPVMGSVPLKPRVRVNADGTYKYVDPLSLDIPPAPEEPIKPTDKQGWMIVSVVSSRKSSRRAGRSTIYRTSEVGFWDYDLSR